MGHIQRHHFQPMLIITNLESLFLDYPKLNLCVDKTHIVIWINLLISFYTDTKVQIPTKWQILTQSGPNHSFYIYKASFVWYFKFLKAHLLHACWKCWRMHVIESILARDRVKNCRKCCVNMIVYNPEILSLMPKFSYKKTELQHSFPLVFYPECT